MRCAERDLRIHLPEDSVTTRNLNIASLNRRQLVTLPGPPYFMDETNTTTALMSASVICWVLAAMSGSTLTPDPLR